MTYKPSRKHRFYAILLVFLFVFVMVTGAWLHFYPSDPSTSPSASNQTMTLNEVTEQVSETTADNELTHGLKQTAKRIVHVPDTRKKINSDSDEGQPISQAEVQVIHGEKLFEKAMQGDILSAHKLRQELWRCDRFPHNKTSLEVAIQKTNNYMKGQASQGRPINGPTGAPHIPGALVFDSEEKNRQHLTEQYQACTRMKGFFSEDLRQQIDELAKAGDVMARYLYAIWTPSFGYDLRMFENNIEWTRKAYEYSYANLIEREPAGLLAFGSSYSEGLFTRQDNRLAQALKKAALTCMYEMPELEEVIRQHVMLIVSPLNTAERIAVHEQFTEFEDVLTSYCQ